MLSVSIIIVTWNALHHLKEYLPSVVKNSNDAEIIIADNASDDGTGEWLKATFPQVKHFLMKKNHGYCGGNNRSASSATGDIIVFLNNDVEVSENWLEPIREKFEENENTAVVQPKILDYQNRSYFEYAGAAGGKMDRLGYPFCRGRLFDTLEEDHGQYDDSDTLAWASGAAFAIRKKLFFKIGQFDERFEFHMEEIDLCWRLMNMGYEIKYAPKSVAFHLGGGSLKTGSSRKIYYNYRNSLLMLLKNTPKGLAFKRIFLRLNLDGVAGVRALLQGRPMETIAIIKAHFGFYSKFRSVSKTRKILLNARKSKKDPKPIYSKLIIWQYFIKGKKRYSEL